MPSTQTQLFPPPLRGSDLSQPLQKYLFTLQNLLPLVLVDTTGGNIVLALPPAGMNANTGQSNQNMEMVFRKTSADANTVTVNGSTHDGPQVLTSSAGAASRVRLKSDGTDWYVIG